MTAITQTSQTPTAAQIARGKHLFELASARAHYGDLIPAGLRAAYNDGYPVRYGTRGSDLQPATDKVLANFEALVPYAAYFDAAYMSDLASVTDGKATKLYNLLPTGPAALSGAAGGTLVANPMLGHPSISFAGLAAFSGYRAAMSAGVVAAASTGRAVIHVGTANAAPNGGSSGRLAAVMTGSTNPVLSIGMRPGAAKWRLEARRRYNDTATGVTIDSDGDSIIGSRFLAMGAINYAGRTVRMLVNGALVIPPTTIEGGAAGVLYTTPNSADLAYQNTGYNGSGEFWGFLNTDEPSVLAGVGAALKAIYGTP